MTLPAPLATWYHIARTQDAKALWGLLADDAVFHSPMVPTPQRGKAPTHAHLAAMLQAHAPSRAQAQAMGAQA